MRWAALLREWARSLNRDVVALGLAVRDPRTPRSAKGIAAAAVAYAISPIDLIPEAVPVLGQLALGFLDDLVIVPLGIMLAIRLIPDDLMAEFREEATRLKGWPTRYAIIAIIVLIWLAGVAVQLWWLGPRAVRFCTQSRLRGRAGGYVEGVGSSAIRCSPAVGSCGARGRLSHSSTRLCSL